MAITGTNIIIALTLTVGASATFAVAHQQGWGGFGDAEIFAPTISCQPPVLSIGWATGVGARSLAETRALINWRKNANRHGRLYASWHNARSRDVSCKMVSEKTAKCTVKGRPCEQNAEIDLKKVF